MDKNDPKQWPRCYPCGKPVDDVLCYATSAGVRWRITCHGESVSAFMSATAIKQATDRGEHIIFGPAFHPRGEPPVCIDGGAVRGRWTLGERSINAPLVRVH